MKMESITTTVDRLLLIVETMKFSGRGQDCRGKCKLTSLAAAVLCDLYHETSNRPKYKESHNRPSLLGCLFPSEAETDEGGR